MVSTRLHDLLANSVSTRPQGCALVAGRERFTYADIDRMSGALANALIEGGVASGDRVVVVLENSMPAVVAFWAILRAGAVACPVNPMTPVSKLDFLLRDSGAAAAILDFSLFGDGESVAALAEALGLVVSVGATRYDLSKTRHMALATVLESARAAPLPDPVRADDLATILYTSGSTGLPKGVMMTHRSMLAATGSINGYLHNRESDIVLCALPMSFDYGLYQMILAFAVGARLILEPPSTLPQTMLARMRAEEVSVFPAMPTLLAMMERLPEHHLGGLERIRYVSSTGAHLAQRHVAFIERAFPNALIYSMFGLTECKRCTFLPPEYLHAKPGSVGIAIPGTEIWIADAQGRRLPPGQTGELVVRSPTIMRGYWKDPVMTSQRLRRSESGGDVVLYTGDLCRMDEDGFLYFVARGDDLIKSRGYRIAPKEIESALLRMDGVVEAAVIGVPDEMVGHALKAFVVLAEGAKASEAQIRAHCGRELEPPLVPAIIEVRSALPRSQTGKIDRIALGAAQA